MRPETFRALLARDKVRRAVLTIPTRMPVRVSRVIEHPRRGDWEVEVRSSSEPISCARIVDELLLAIPEARVLTAVEVACQWRAERGVKITFWVPAAEVAA